MNESFSEFDLIYKAIRHTYDVLEGTNGEVREEVKAAHEQYLLALSHKTLIETQYLKAMIE
ncbi:DUF3921 family protein [Microbacteriaceae bacterium 4G12]